MRYEDEIMRYEESTIQQPGVSFWNALRAFWPNERVEAWYGAIFPQGPNVCQNLICLSPDAHAYWERAYFALKPIRLSEDKKRLDVQFFWLSSNPRVSSVHTADVPSLPANLDHGPGLTKLFDIETGEEIRSGREISLETDDPVSRPLPDFGLLEMQWILHRVAAISGATEHQGDLYEGSDGNGDVEEDLRNMHI